MDQFQNALKPQVALCQQAASNPKQHPLSYPPSTAMVAAMLEHTIYRAVATTLKATQQFRRLVVRLAFLQPEIICFISQYKRE
jgi:hypothetical protein